MSEESTAMITAGSLDYPRDQVNGPWWYASWSPFLKKPPAVGLDVQILSAGLQWQDTNFQPLPELHYTRQGIQDQTVHAF